MSVDEADSNEKITYKIILIGDSSVGKTCLFKKITTGDYFDKNISTIGMDRKSFQLKIPVNVNGEEKERSFEIQLWDTAGQERFRSITTGYYKGSQGLFLLYDITNIETFENLEKWISGIKESLGTNEKGDKYIIILLGNKLDIVKDHPDMRRVSAEEAEQKCKEFDIIWGGECSVKDFTVEELENKFKGFTKEIYKRIGWRVVKSQVIKKINPGKKKEGCACSFK
jgi:small GTP-binding protein